MKTKKEIDDLTSKESLFNIWIIEKNGDRILARENINEELKNALLNAANDGAKLRGLDHRYEATPVESNV